MNRNSLLALVIMLGIVHVPQVLCVLLSDEEIAAEDKNREEFNKNVKNSRSVQDLLKRYRVTAQKCRPLVQSVKEKEAESLLSTSYGELLCALAGYKPLVLTLKQSWQDLPNKFKQFIKNEQFKYIEDGSELLIYPRGGRTGALLFYMSLHMQNNAPQNSYILGWLLGYPEEDIRAFYRNNHIEKQFMNDKTTSLNWILKLNVMDIDAWVRKNNIQEHEIEASKEKR